MKLLPAPPLTKEERREMLEEAARDSVSEQVAEQVEFDREDADNGYTFDIPTQEVEVDLEEDAAKGFVLCVGRFSGSARDEDGDEVEWRAQVKKAVRWRRSWRVELSVWGETL